MANVNVLALSKQAEIRSPDALLEVILPEIVTSLSGATSVDVFRLTRGGMIVWYGEQSTYETGAFVPLEANSIYQQAILKRTPMFDESEQIIVAPLTNPSEIFAILVVKGTTAQEDVSRIADELSMALHAEMMRSLLQQQITLTGEMTLASSLPHVAAIIAKHVIQSGQFVSVNRLDYDAEGTIIGGAIVATANRQRSYPQELNMDIDVPVLKMLTEILIADGELLITDIDREDRFSKAGKSWLKNQNINSIFALPLWIEGQLRAFIGLFDTQRPLAFSNTEKELLQNIAHQASIAIERQNLLERTQRSARRSDEQLRVLKLINELISQSDDTQRSTSLLQRTSDILLEVTHVDHVGIVMREENSAYVVSEAPAAGLLGSQVEVGEDSIHALLENSSAPYIVADVANDPQLPQATRAALLDTGVQSIIILPMLDENNDLIGSVGLDYFTKQEQIDRDVIEAAQTVVTQVALSLQKVKLLAEAQQKAQQLEQLTAFGQSLRAYLTLEEIITTTLNYCPDVLDAEYTGILLYDRATNTIRNTAQYLDHENTIQLDAAPITEEMNSIALQAWQDHKMIKIDDLHTDWEWKHPLHRKLQSIVALPLSLAGVTLGIIEVGSEQPNHFNTTTLTTLRQISNQLAIALSNASAYSQSQRLARKKTQANDIIAQLQQQLEVSDILQVTVNQLGKALGAKRARIRLGTTPTPRTGDDSQ